jgi:adenine-specific DNA-methyltransferase
MARIEDLVSQVGDARVRAELADEVAHLKSRRTFGLVFERHIPETVMIPNGTVKAGATVVRRADEGCLPLRVHAVADGIATVTPLDGAATEPIQVPIADLGLLLTFGEAVYPTLTSLGAVRAGGDAPYHAVINGENLHALELLAAIHEGDVDCIYIDPPYNSGARDWKYNNDFVDIHDRWRHSKWLSFMEKRLRVARRLLRPDGVLVITIDENEVFHLGVLLEELFPDYLHYMVTIVINPKGTAKVNFSRVAEHALFVVPKTGSDVIEFLAPPDDEPEGGEDELEETEDDPDAREVELTDEDIATEIDAEVAADAGTDYAVLYLRRRGAESSSRAQRWRQFYAIYVNERTLQVEGIGPPIGKVEPYEVTRNGDILSVFPVDAEGNDRVWRYGRTTMQRLIEQGAIRVGRYNQGLDTYALNHWKPRSGPRRQRVRTVWWRKAHDAGTHGTTLVTKMLGRRNAFSFPKSLYAVRDTLDTIVRSRPNAVIVDFFGGSGTTLHATMLMNADDGGRRRCILVTNNEVNEKVETRLRAEGHFPGDLEFEEHGIFESTTRPRVEAAISGRRPDGAPIRVKYRDSSRKLSDGLQANVEFFRLDYLDPIEVDLGLRLDALAPVLWEAAGGAGERVPITTRNGYFLPAASPFAVLFRASGLRPLREALSSRPDVTHVFIVTDSEEGFVALRAELPGRLRTVMLFRDYLRSLAPRGVRR